MNLAMPLERPGDVPGANVHFAPREVLARYRADGSIILHSCAPMGAVVGNIVDYLERGARDHPDRVAIGQRWSDGAWRTIDYDTLWARARAVAQGLLRAGATVDHPVMILSGASIEHAVVTFACLLVGIPVVPVSPSYSLLPEARAHLEEIAALIVPAIVFVQDERAFAEVRQLPHLGSARWLSATGGPTSAAIAGWYQITAGNVVDIRRARVTPDTIGKILFTSGSTGAPKGVINSHGMLCHALESGASVMDSETPQIQVDWLPWHHTLGGNAVLHGSLRSGGSLYIDDGRPTRELFRRTIENIRSTRPTIMQSVPAAFAMLVPALEHDERLCTAFFSRLERLIYAGASLPQEIWERMQALALRTTGAPVIFGSGYGTTETGPGIAITHWASTGGGEIGLPLPGVEIKLLPIEEQFEIRVRGANVTPGYYKRSDLTAAAFDEEGFYRVGDLVRLADPGNLSAGLVFGGRLSENFKLANGSWVATGGLRLAILEACQPLVADAVLAGADRDDVRAMLWLAPTGHDAADPLQETPEAARHAQVAEISRRLASFNRSAHGPTHRIAAFRILTEPPSIGQGEITDKGYVNQRCVLARRAALAEGLYAPTPWNDVICLVPGKDQ